MVYTKRLGITTLLFYVHAVDREYLGAPAAEASKGRTQTA